MKKYAFLSMAVILVGFTIISFWPRAITVKRIPASLPSSEVHESINQFLHSDFGSISLKGMKTNTMPLKITITGLILLGRKEGWIEKNSTDYMSIFKRFGFFIPSSYSNGYPLSRDDFKELPLGLNKKNSMIIGPLVKIQGMNITCAACHVGRLYDQNGIPSEVAVLGIPNTSINFEQYLNAIYKGLGLYIENTKASYALLKTIFPELTRSEAAAIKIFINGIVKKRMGQLKNSIDAPLPFSSGSPGVTNGVASLKFVLGIMDMTKAQAEYGFTSIPSLGDRFFRSSMLYDGAYYPPDKNPFERKNSWDEKDAEELGAIVAAFTMPTMGQTDKGVVKQKKKLTLVTKHIIEGFESPAFPGKVDQERSLKGFEIFKNNCASCHGDYERQNQKAVLKSFPNKHIDQDEMGTDPERWKVMDKTLENKVNDLATNKFLKASQHQGYVAPILTSLWLTAPYLHNGSVPTLWDLMNPEKRPKKFLVGGHNLDLKKVGVLLKESDGVMIYPESVVPFSAPEMYDTSLPGRSNKGHEEPFNNLSEEEKTDLLEFLKLL